MIRGGWTNGDVDITRYSALYVPAQPRVGDCCEVGRRGAGDVLQWLLRSGCEHGAQVPFQGLVHKGHGILKNKVALQTGRHSTVPRSYRTRAGNELLQVSESKAQTPIDRRSPRTGR